MTVFTHLNASSSIGDILFAQPNRYGPLLEAAQHIMRSEGEFVPEVRELLAAFVSGLNECSFCHGVHTEVAKAFGVASPLLVQLLDDIERADIEDEIKPVFRFAKKLTVSPAKIVEADRAAIVAAGYSSTAVSDVVAIVALFSFFNRLVDGHGVKGSAAIFERDAQMLSRFGYVPPAQ